MSDSPFRFSSAASARASITRRIRSGFLAALAEIEPRAEGNSHVFSAKDAYLLVRQMNDVIGWIEDVAITSTAEATARARTDALRQAARADATLQKLLSPSSMTKRERKNCRGDAV